MSIGTVRGGGEVAIVIAMSERVWLAIARTLRAAFVTAVLALVAWALFGVAGCASLPAIPASPRSHAAQDATTVRVEVLCIETDPFSGGEFSPPPTITFGAGVATGVMVSARHVLTAAHVVRCPVLPQVTIAFADGHRERVWVEREWPDADLARLVIIHAGVLPGDPAPPELAPVPAVDDALCAAVAWPAREWHCGPVDRVHAWNARADVEVITPSQQGNSGAPVYDSAGRLAGIVATGSPDACGVTSLAKHPEVMP